MSGGSLDYFFGVLEDHVGDFGDKELDHLVKDLAELFHAREWYLSGDTSEGEWNEERDAFKRKWFTEHGRQERINQYLKEIDREIRSQFSRAMYCRDCANWTPEGNGKYGLCSRENRCLMHRSDTACGKFEKRGGVE